MLLAQAIRFIPLFVTKQVRYKVTDIPTKRTIQYYVHKGLISKPGRRGRRIAFSYRHLLQVLAVKRLQNDYLPLRKIAEIMRSSSERELEDILIGERRVLSPLRPSDNPSPNSLWTSWRRVRIDDHVESSRLRRDSTSWTLPSISTSSTRRSSTPFPFFPCQGQIGPHTTRRPLRSRTSRMRASASLRPPLSRR